MGMTDRQFDSYQSIVLGFLKRARDEINQTGNSEHTILDEFIEKLESELKKP